MRAFGRVLQRRDLRLLFSALLISLTGSWAYNVALVAVILDRTGSVGWVSVAALCRFLPGLLLGPYAGVVAERFERVRVLVMSDLACLSWQTALALLTAVKGPIVLLIAVATLSAISSLVYSPAVAALLPQLGGEDDLAAANALNDSINNLVVILGPAIGAGLLLVASPTTVFAFNAASFGGSALLVSRMVSRSRPTDVTEGGTAGPLRQMLAGARAIAQAGLAAALVAFSVAASFLYGTDTVIFAALSTNQLHTGSPGYGYLLAALGVGGIIAAPFLNRLAGLPRLGLVIVAGMLGYCLPTALLVFVSSGRVAFGLEVVRGAGTLVVDVLAITALQRALPKHLIARVFGIFFALVTGAIALGAVVAPIALRTVGLHGALLLFGLGPAALALVAYPWLHRLDSRSASRMRIISARVAVLEPLGMFEAASRTTLERLAETCTERAVASGTRIITEGDPADALYVLVEGNVRVTARTGLRAERELAMLDAPAYFGEIGLLNAVPRSASVTAVMPCRLYQIGAPEFFDALSTSAPSPALLEGVRNRLARSQPPTAFEDHPATSS